MKKISVVMSTIAIILSVVAVIFNICTLQRLAEWKEHYEPYVEKMQMIVFDDESNVALDNMGHLYLNDTEGKTQIAANVKEISYAGEKRVYIVKEDGSVYYLDLK